MYKHLPSCSFQYVTLTMSPLHCTPKQKFYTDCLAIPFTNISTLIPALMDNNIHNKVSDKITYLFADFNGATVEVCEWISNFTPHPWLCVYLSMLGLNSVSISISVNGALINAVEFAKTTACIDHNNNKTVVYTKYIIVMRCDECC